MVVLSCRRRTLMKHVRGRLDRNHADATFRGGGDQATKQVLSSIGYYTTS